ncbi:MAG: serine/threonine-protein phosphatase [Anaerolineaceae bacterium]|nr:serine/threonine-protein phosphatase [Anaerolineaceae bacterium]
MDLFRRLFTQSQAKPDELISKTIEPEPFEEQKATEATTVPIPAVNAVEEKDESEIAYADGATRPLPPETVITTSNMHLTFGQSTDVGMVRSNNQDAAFSFFSTSRNADQRPDFGLFIVADGMGGHHDGEKASAATAHIVAAQVTSSVYLPMLTGENDADRIPITEALVSAVQKANADIIARIPDGGTTLTATAIIGDLAYVVHVGDSRIYLITKDGIEQITRDHSLVQRLIELDQLKPEEAAHHPQRNVLYRALGQSESLEIDALTRRLPPNSRLLLCSDGLWNVVEEKDMLGIVIAHDDPQEACDKLVALANTNGGTDNITAILLYIPSS